MRMSFVSLGLVLGLGLFGACSGGGRHEWTPPKRTPVNPVTFDAAAVPQDQAVFPLGVMAGDPTPGGMLLWTGADPGAALRLKVWIPDVDPAQPDVVDLLVDEAVTADENGFVHQTIDGLVPGVWHRYAFFQETVAGQPTARSEIGAFVVPPPEGALVRMTISGTHGLHQSEFPFPVLAANAAFEPYSLYFQLGDAIYSDSTREPVTPAACTFDEYLNYWRNAWRQSGYRAVLPLATYLPVPDDHEVANNYHAEFEDPACPGRVANGKNAFYAANPIAQDPENPLRLYRSWRYGDTLEVFALDARSERLPSTRDDPYADPPLVNPAAQFLSPEQMDWLKESLEASPATFKLILNSVPIIAFPNPPWLNVADTWAAYSTQRKELIDFLLDSPIENVYFLSGDFHMATVGRLDPPGQRGHALWEFFMGPGAQSNPLGNREYIIDTLGEAYDPLPPDQFAWGSPDPTLTYIDLDPVAKPPTLTVRYYDPHTGAELFRATFADGIMLEDL